MDPKEGQTQQKKPHENRLAKEKSPYLLQHKNNPVDWYFLFVILFFSKIQTFTQVSEHDSFDII
jgi:hypothetical protein